jgi:hypothetical protein
MFGLQYHRIPDAPYPYQSLGCVRVRVRIELNNPYQGQLNILAVLLPTRFLPGGTCMGLSVPQLFEAVKGTATSCARKPGNPVCAGELDAVGMSVSSAVIPQGDEWQQCVGTVFVQVSHQDAPTPAEFAASTPTCSRGTGWLRDQPCQQQLNATCNKLPLSVGAIYSDWSSREDLQLALSASAFIPAMSGMRSFLNLAKLLLLLVEGLTKTVISAQDFCLLLLQ